jgi:hypothetical protein
MNDLAFTFRFEQNSDDVRIRLTWRPEHYRRMRLGRLLLIPLCIAIALAPLGLRVVLIACACGAILIAMALWTARRWHAFDRYFARPDRARIWFGPRTVSMNPLGIIMETDFWRREIPWYAVGKLHRIEKGIAIAEELSPDKCSVFIPNRAIEDLSKAGPIIAQAEEWRGIAVLPPPRPDLPTRDFPIYSSRSEAAKSTLLKTGWVMAILFGLPAALMIAAGICMVVFLLWRGPERVPATQTPITMPTITKGATEAQ